MEKGILLKRYGGFYYVYSGGEVYECICRGKHRLKWENIYPGDNVELSFCGKGKGVIERVLPRKNLLIRPSVANVSQVVCVVAFRYPDPDLSLLDRLLVITEFYCLNAVICLNKRDLVTEDEAKKILEIYDDLGYKVLVTSAKTGRGLEELKSELKGNISVFAGQSGVGKSSLLNAIIPNLNLKVGEISKKLKRGRHTTKHVELIRLPNGGLVADTPGFSKLNLPEMKAEELESYFPELCELGTSCKFSSCLHSKEPGCAVIESVERGLVNESRYRNYLRLLEEVIKQERCF